MKGRILPILTSKHIPFEKVAGLAQAKGKYLLVAGLTDGDGPAAGLLRTGNHLVAGVSEALTVWHSVYRQKAAIVIGVYDDKGLMYALLETARQIGYASDAHQLYPFMG